MAKKKSKKVAKKITKKKELDISKSFSEFYKKYPGFIYGIIIAIIIIILAIWSIGAVDPYAVEKEEQARVTHQTIQMQIDEMLLALDTIDNNYDDFYDDDYYNSIKDDFIWLKEKDIETFSRKGEDYYLREFANFIFLNRLLALNEEFLLDFYDFDEELIIEQAKGVELDTEDITTLFEIDELFENELINKDIFYDQLNELINEYQLNKKLILNGDSGRERKFVEAKKLLMLSYTSEN
jgi:hypothetical protein